MARNKTLAERELRDAVELTDNSGGTADDTVEAVSGSGADPAINNNFAELTTKVNYLLDRLSKKTE